MNTTNIIIFVLTAILTTLVYLLRRMRKDKKNAPDLFTPGKDGCVHGNGCCGGINCKRKEDTDRIVYYDDEELDRFIGRDPKSYNHQEKEAFAEVYTTLLPQDIGGWFISLSKRKIIPPIDIIESATKQEHS